MLDIRIIEEVRKYIEERLIAEPDVSGQASGTAVMADAMPEMAETPRPRREKAAFSGAFAKRRAAMVCDEHKLPAAAPDVRQELLERLAEKDEGFSEYLLRKIDASGMTDAECYTKAQITRQLFNRIKNIREYRPSKTTVIALGFALELSADEFAAMLRKAGFSLSDSSEFDLIVGYCIDHGIYGIDDINELLFEFDQPLLGSK